MKLASFRRGERESFGIVSDGTVSDLGQTTSLPDLKALLANGRLASLSDEEKSSAPLYSLESVSLLPVIPAPSKIFCIGTNYASHLIETGREPPAKPLVFTRFADTQIGAEGTMLVPHESDNFDFEGELAVIIGVGGRRIAREDAMQHVAGYACYNDGSVRDWQKHTHQFTPGKNFPSTGAFGPWMVTTDEISDPRKLTLETRLNGRVVQSAEVSDLVYDIPELIAYCSTFTSLAPGDVIVTGTTGGVGAFRVPPLWMKDGDIVEVEVPGIGVLRNPIVKERI